MPRGTVDATIPPGGLPAQRHPRGEDHLREVVLDGGARALDDRRSPARPEHDGALEQHALVGEKVRSFMRELA